MGLRRTGFYSGSFCVIVSCYHFFSKGTLITSRLSLLQNISKTHKLKQTVKQTVKQNKYCTVGWYQWYSYI